LLETVAAKIGMKSFSEKLKNLFLISGETEESPVINWTVLQLFIQVM
jgi:hypothetical protein